LIIKYEKEYDMFIILDK